MTEKKHIVIVGGGYLGSMSALLFSQRDDFKVTLVEKQNRLGGLYNSAWVKDDYHFDYGSRAILATGVAELDEVLFSILPDDEYPKTFANLKEFSFQQGQRLEYSNCLDARLLPIEQFEQGKAELLAITPECVIGQEFDNLGARALATYGATLTRHLIKPAIEKLTGLPIDQLDADALEIHGLHRLIIADQEESKRLKDSSDFNGARIAFARYDDNKSTLIKSYPQTAGLSDFGRRIQSYFEKADNVDLIPEQSVTSVESDSHDVRTATLENGQIIACDHLLWTIPSIFLARMLGVKLQGIKPPVFRNTVLAHYIFSGGLNTDAYFLYNYEPDCLAYRSSFYENFTLSEHPYHSATVEVFHDALEPNLEDLQAKVFEELKATDCISSDSQIVEAKMQFHRNSWPNFSTDFFANQAHVNKIVIGDFKNLHLLGKANGKHHSAALVHSAFELYSKL